MRVLNDRRPENEQAPEMSFFAIAVHGLFTALGILFPVIGPLPMIASHQQLPEPWPKVAALVGSILAMTLLSVPAEVVIPTFVIGVFIADRVGREVSFWRLFASTLSLGLGLAFLGLFLGARARGMAVVPYWEALVNSVVSELKQANTMLALNPKFDWDMARRALIGSGPLFALSALVTSFWVSVGLSAHLGFIARPGHPYSGTELRKLRFPNWISLLFVSVFIADRFHLTGEWVVLPGVLAVLGSVMFIQGTILMSDLFARRAIQGGVRTLLYCLMVLNVYAVVGLGVVSPWFLRRRSKLEEKS